MTEFSKCVKVLGENLMSFYGYNAKAPSFNPTLAKLCNDGIPGYTKEHIATEAVHPQLCPNECWKTSSCAMNAAMNTHIANVLCPDLCGHFGLTVWPNTNSSTLGNPEWANCRGSQESWPMAYAVPQCAKVGDLQSSAATTFVTALAEHHHPDIVLGGGA